MKSEVDWHAEIVRQLITGAKAKGLAHHEILPSIIREIQADALHAAVKRVRAVYPRGSSHTYASENADIYIAQERACEMCAESIFPLLPKKP